MKNLILFGPPGAGKGTQSDQLIARYGFVHISTGDEFRKHITEQTELGKRAQEYSNNGMLVPDQVTIDMLKAKIDEYPEAKGFLFDGFPRTVPQAEALDAFMQSMHTDIHYVIALDVTEDEVRARIEKRQEISNRADDKSDKVTKRIAEYFDKTIHVLPHYEVQGRLKHVHGIGDIQVIFAEICQILDA